MRRVVYRDAEGRKRVAIVMPDGTVRASKTMDRDALATRACEDATGQVVKITKFSTFDPEWGVDRLRYQRIEIERAEPPADLARDLVAKAASWLATAIEKGMDADQAGAYGEEFARQIGAMVAESVAKSVPQVEPVVKGRANVDEYDPLDPFDDRAMRRPQPGEDVSTEKGAQKPGRDEEDHNGADFETPQPGQSPLPHLDSARNKKLAQTMGSPVIDSGASKSLVRILRSTGYESVGVDEQGIEHFIHDNWKSEALVHPSEGFALKSGYDGSVVAGVTSDDLLAALDQT